MAAPIVSRPNVFEDFPSSEQLYELFLPAKLKVRIQALAPKASSAAIDIQLARLLTTIDFGTVACANPNYVIGTPSYSDPYPATNSTTTRLLGFRIGEPAPAGTTRPRAVVTAGMHAREMLPPGAVAKYFRDVLVNYVVGKLTGVFPDIRHAGFYYQAGPSKAEDGTVIDSAMASPIYIKGWSFAGTDIRRIIQQLEIIVMPTVNPGGRDFVVARPAEVSIPDKQNLRRLWRHNRRVLPSSVIGTPPPLPNSDDALRPFGADINRNANFAWDVYKYYDNLNASRYDNSNYDPSIEQQSYRGPSANSELETCAVLAVLATKNVADMPVAQRNFNTTPGLDARLAAQPFLGALFHLDVHSYTGGIYTPWGTDMPSPPGIAADPAMNFRNTQWDTRRDGPRGNAYQEFLPSAITFGTSPRIYNLLQAHTTHFGNVMQRAIERAVVEPANASPATKARLSKRSRYQVASSAAALYPTPGTANDYAIGISIPGTSNLVTPAPSYANPTRQGPTIGLTIEVGMPGDGDFSPLNKLNVGQSFTTRGLYSKVERETLAGLHSFLLQCVSYAIGPKPKQ